MDKYLSLVYLYNRAGYRKLLIIFLAIPICYLLIFLIRTGSPADASPFMLMERGFGGVPGILTLIAAALLVCSAIIDSINGKKALKASHATTGYTIRRICISPISSYFIMFAYSLILILIIWAIAIASLYVIGRVSLTMAGAEEIEVKIALGLLRTKTGAALIPIANPVLIAFDFVAVITLAGECARSCYLGWHNGSPSAGVILIAVLMFIAWSFDLNTGYTLLLIIVAILYAMFSIGDVIFREKRPKGDPFRVNKYSGIIDMDSDDFEEDVFLEVNKANEAYEAWSEETSVLNKYGRIRSKGNARLRDRLSLFKLRRRFMPIGSNMEKANFLLAICICLGIGEHLLFLVKYYMQINVISRSIKGVTIEPGVSMPYFSVLLAHTMYGYIAAIIAVFIVQAYWNYAYYNKETKSVYVMKRLSDRKEYPRTIWVAPFIESMIILIIMIVNLAVDLGIYIYGTPDIALRPDYLMHIL